MLLALIPFLVGVGLLLYTAARNQGNAFIQIYAIIIFAYLNLFPFMFFIFDPQSSVNSFLYAETSILIFFQLPLILTLNYQTSSISNYPKDRFFPTVYYSFFLVFLLIQTISFVYVAYNYDLFFRRIGFDALERNSADVPTILLYAYRSSVELSFYMITLGFFISKNFNKKQPIAFIFARWAHFIVFLTFYVINSRMHVILLISCLIIIVYPHVLKKMKLSGLAVTTVSLLFIATSLTLFRETFLEVDNNRLSSATDTIQLIAGRLDATAMLQDLYNHGYSLFTVNFSGLNNLIDFFISFFTDIDRYNAIKNDIATSPSVYIIRQILPGTFDDFNKTNIMDITLTFGLWGLPFFGVFIGIFVKYMQKYLNSAQYFSRLFLLFIFMLPIIWEFEKEFFGAVTSIIKWLPVFALSLFMFDFNKYQRLSAPN
jgi:hypothetical protein